MTLNEHMAKEADRARARERREWMWITIARWCNVIVAVALVAMAVSSVYATTREPPPSSAWQSDLLIRCLNGGAFLIEKTMVQCVVTEIR
jgi:hypothetical protein